jgi:hypothetical protein
VRQSASPLRAPPVSGEAHTSCCVSGLTTHWRCASGTGPVGWVRGTAQPNIVAALPSTGCLGSWSENTARHASSPSLTARRLVTKDALPSELMFHCCFCDVASQGHMMDLVAAAPPGGGGPPAAMASTVSIAAIAIIAVAIGHQKHPNIQTEFRDDETGLLITDPGMIEWMKYDQDKDKELNLFDALGSAAIACGCLIVLAVVVRRGLAAVRRCRRVPRTFDSKAGLPAELVGILRPSLVSAADAWFHSNAVDTQGLRP